MKKSIKKVLLTLFYSVTIIAILIVTFFDIFYLSHFELEIYYIVLFSVGIVVNIFWIVIFVSFIVNVFKDDK